MTRFCFFFQAKGLGLVIANVAALSRTAFALGWKGPVLGPVNTGEGAVRKFRPVETAPKFVHTDEAGGSEFEKALARMHLDLAEATQELNRLTAVKMNLQEEVKGFLATCDAERSKLQAKEAELNSKAQKTPQQADVAAVSPRSSPVSAVSSNAVAEESAKQAWMKATEESAGESRRAADQARDERYKEEREVSKLQAQVANMVAQKANLMERMQQLADRKKAALEALAALPPPPQPVSAAATPSPPPSAVEETVAPMKALKNAAGYFYTQTAGERD